MKCGTAILFFLSTLIFFTSSCRIAKERVAAIKRLQVLKDEREVEINTIEYLKIQTRLETAKNNNNISNIIEKKLDEKREGLNIEKRQIDSLEYLLNNSKKITTVSLQKVNTLLNNVSTYRSSYANRMSFYLMVGNVIKPNNFKIFDNGAFFGPGKYKIPANDVPLAMKSFAPIFDSLLKMSEPFKNIKRVGTIMIYGYSDETGFDTNSSIYNYLKDLLFKDGIFNPTKQELNKKLSEIRALELTKTVSESFLVRGENTFMNDPNLKIDFIAVGKGEEYPDKSIKDYKIDDPRRRICVCHWIVLPEE